MRKLVLMCAILAGVVSVGMGAMSDEEWNRGWHNCFENNDKSACQAIIDNGGLPSVEQCYIEKGKGNCFFVGGFYLFAERYREAIPYFEKAIALGDNRGYILLGTTYYLLQDYYNAKKYYEIACDTNDGASCLVVAKMYDRGQGVKQNSSTAAQYYHKACNLGDQRACSAIEAKRFEAERFEAMLKYLPESREQMLEMEKLELERKKLELERLELEQKLRKYR